MSINATYAAALASPDSTHGVWLEIEGTPYAFGSFAITAPASFFSGRSAKDRPLGVLPYLLGIPKMLAQEVDTLSGGAFTAGAVAFEVGDINGYVAQLCGIGYQTGFTALSADLTAVATTINVYSTAGFLAGDILYIGTEAIQIGTVFSGTQFTGCTRSYFRSTAQAFGQGISVGNRPYTLANRRCWYNQVAQAGQGAPLSLDVAAGDNNKVVRFSGLLGQFYMEESNRFTMTAKSMDAELDGQVFRALRSFPIGNMIMSDDPSSDTSDEGAGTVQVAGYAGYNLYPSVGYGNDRLYYIPLQSTGAPMVANTESAVFRIDDEIFVMLGLDQGNVQLTARAQFGTKPAKHIYGAIAQEIIPVFAKEGPLTSLGAASKFTAVTPTGVEPDHPLALFLQVMLSKAGGLVNGAYDTLPSGWGKEIDASRVDVYGIEQAMLEEPTLRFGGVIERPVNFLAWAREILAFAGYYYYIALDDKLKVKRLRPPSPDELTNIRTIDDNVRIRKSKPRWDANFTGAVREAIYSYAYDILRNQFKCIDIYKFPGGDLYSKGLARTIEYSSTMVYPGHSGTPGEPPFNRFDIHAWLLTRAEFFKVRYGRPPPIVFDRLTYDQLDIEIGQIVFVTSNELPSTSTGVLGMTAEVGEVIGVAIDDVNKVVEVKILMTGWQLGAYRTVAPTLEVEAVISAGASTASFTMKANAFTDTTGPLGGVQTDMKVERADGQLVGTLPATGVVGGATLWKTDLSASVQVTITYWDAATRQVDIQTAGGGAWPFLIFVGQFLTLSTFDKVSGVNSQGPTVEVLSDKYGFGADSSDLLSGPVAGHVLFPT